MSMLGIQKVLTSSHEEYHIKEMDFKLDEVSLVKEDIAVGLVRNDVFGAQGEFLQRYK